MAYTKSNITTRKFDVVIVGAGGSGMRASLQPVSYTHLTLPTTVRREP